MAKKKGNHKNAPGRPGADPVWSSSAKTAVGTAANPVSQVWFTVADGILTEVFWPEVDCPCTREMQFVVTDGKHFVSEEKRDTKQTLEYLAPGVPALRLTNECKAGRYRIEKEIVTDPDLDVLLMRTRFLPRKGEELFLHVLLAPHLANEGKHNDASVKDFWGEEVLVARRDHNALVLACSVAFLKCSAGYVGVSDGEQDLRKHKRMKWSYSRAANGNVALAAQIDLKKCGGTFTLALGFDGTAIGAVHHVRASLLDGFDAARDKFIEQWSSWQKPLEVLAPRGGKKNLDFSRVSAAVLRTHAAKKFPGGIVASLSTPWGFSRGDDDRGGYHLTWPRDLAEVTGGLLAAGCAQNAREALRFLASTQEKDGSWPQNMWLRGDRNWNGKQLDECALPILLVALALREKAIDRSELERLWPMVRGALDFMTKHGPVTEQDRWEELGGYSPYTLATEVAALLEAAEFTLEPELAKPLRELADDWNEKIEQWTYATGTELAQKCGVDGYYVRIAPNDCDVPWRGQIPLKNVRKKQSIPAHSMVACDALALVRFGLRAPDDPRIVNTVRVIDSLLKVKTPHGVSWHRYNRDGYGEHKDGSPFDGTGIGRAWPLLTGERAHYELAAGRKTEARRLAKAMEAFASEGGMIPEQIWDTADLPKRGLIFGKPSGSGMPLAWAHAEYLKLLRSLRDGKVFDLPAAPAQRYRARK